MKDLGKTHLRPRNWQMLAFADIDPLTISAITGLSVSDVEAQLQAATSLKTTVPAVPATPSCPSFLTRPEHLRSRWGTRLRA